MVTEGLDTVSIVASFEFESNTSITDVEAVAVGLRASLDAFKLDQSLIIKCSERNRKYQSCGERSKDIIEFSNLIVYLLTDSFPPFLASLR